MPLGNLTSQFFANVYLNELDQFVKHKLRAKYYIRYVDDFVILDRSKPKLANYKKAIIIFLKERLNLQLHPEKSQILKLEKGIPFLGFRIFFHHKLIRKKNKRKFERNMEKLKKPYQKEKVNREKIIEKFEGWLAYISHANTYKYRREITRKFNSEFPARPQIDIISVKKHETFNDKIDQSNFEFSQQKTLFHIKKGLSVKEIAQQRGLKEGTVWDHITKLIEHHQLQLKSILPNYKIKKILANIQSNDDKLKDIKTRINNDSISYNDINCILANLRGKDKKKSIHYFINWYKRTNCLRKCYFNKKQRQECRIKLQQLATENTFLKFTKNEFLDFLHNQTKTCILPDKQKKHFMSYKEFKQRTKGKFKSL